MSTIYAIIDKDSRFGDSHILPDGLLLKWCPRTFKFLPFVHWNGIGPDARLMCIVDMFGSTGQPQDMQVLVELINELWLPTVLGITADGSKVMRRP